MQVIFHAHSLLSLNSCLKFESDTPQSLLQWSKIKIIDSKRRIMFKEIVHMRFLVHRMVVFVFMYTEIKSYMISNCTGNPRVFISCTVREGCRVVSEVQDNLLQDSIPVFPCITDFLFPSLSLSSVGLELFSAPCSFCSPFILPHLPSW